MAGGERIAELHKLRKFLMPIWDFDAIAREQGVVALRACDVSLAVAECAVAETLDILAKVTRDNLN
jgi:hypothetical protein